MEVSGNLTKMQSENKSKIIYTFALSSNKFIINELIDKKIKLEATGKIFCVSCGCETYKSFAQGFCYKCFLSAPEADDCILKPELCKAHEGISRNQKWAEEHCLQPHYVYLALTNQVKVGVTRSTQVPTRWIDQGAWKAIKLAITPNRYTAGLIEVSLKKHLPDKTNWQKMLKNENNEKINLLDEKSKIYNLLGEKFKEYYCNENEITTLEYPVTEYPKKVTSFNLDTNRIFEGILKGIKGQYLILENGEVLNVRKFTGYEVHFSA